MPNNKDKMIRNIAIIAHVDHGKTTLVDALLRQSGTFRDNEEVPELAMDSNPLERERGITIFSKNASIHYRGYKINLVDTPGHADFGSEVERVLSMVDGVLLLVDAVDGPMPQTRFVLSKSLKLNLKPIVVINKIDRTEARPHWALDQIFDLFVSLDASDEQLDFPVVYSSGKNGTAATDLKQPQKNILPLLDAIVDKVPAPQGNPNEPFQMLVTSIDCNDYVGRMAIGRILHGSIKVAGKASRIKRGGAIETGKITRLYGFEGLKRIEIQEAGSGDIVALAGFEDVDIGETIADPENPEALHYVDIDLPTIAMLFSVNTSPFAGLEGQYVTSRQLRDRLYRELKSNVGLRVEDTGSPDSLKVSGRGELHLSILIETMRREGYELAVSRPEVIMRDIAGKLCEPFEYLVIDVDDAYVGPVMERLGGRKAEMQNMKADGKGRTRLEYIIPARGLIGFRGQFLTDTRGTGIMHHNFEGYQPCKGEISIAQNGALVAMETGVAASYSLDSIQERGIMFAGPGDKIYEGMIVGERPKENDLVVNLCKTKRLTNIRNSNAEEAIRLSPPKIMTLEEALEFIADDELVEVTPKAIRLRKKILSDIDRRRARRVRPEEAE
ncbi:translational GTPase TypA [candidate division TA06 bacterium]|uniref:Large ribosomal subunit assembly factor BipA n=1 Tax=candidate division TA06 bacterium TaxID=2250710 RepID=A0A933IBY2_UNCT6|nr:translational GTPase TypA [candidate division TA06 bacterium]